MVGLVSRYNVKVLPLITNYNMKYTSNLNYFFIEAVII